MANQLLNMSIGRQIGRRLNLTFKTRRILGGEFRTFLKIGIQSGYISLGKESGGLHQPQQKEICDELTKLVSTNRRWFSCFLFAADPVFAAENVQLSACSNLQELR